MKVLFYLGIFGLLLFEFLKVYFIMPMPGSQQWASLEFAYLLHQSRWFFRCSLIIIAVVGLMPAFAVTRKWLPITCLVIVVGFVWMLNFKMSADAMFKEPQNLNFQSKGQFTGSDSMLVVVTSNRQETKAYPVRYLVYHHQVRDYVGGDPVMVTYCSVCRTGRVFSPLIDGNEATFRLVGMDYFNAMFEDAGTGSWWQQATGEAIAGPLKGHQLKELEALQMSVHGFFNAYPDGLIMEADPDFLTEYDSLGKYEVGESESELTGTSPFSWDEKSWVVGVTVDGESKAYDWNALVAERLIHDQIGNESIVLILSDDSQSFVAFRRESSDTFSLERDTLISGKGKNYSFTGASLNPSYPDLERIQAYQEFWHSWRTFRPNTTRYPD
ncbi:DUF3179 domain-containing protein [Algoriphagus halophytocola]|uniref:DUF3179 domain-containing protein n=1 Tax=Algoriphagus halophytocola TaxID=2991499 RepID=A0ABY6MGW2_9BACT|nr:MULTISPECIES: DUF3179 domain-containing protein [unclassified Algoriphagus]UZD21886.1 DUF3179 domain-containing protein [Algoriphagus sp. TR-M5]WBL43136.1 DUF3179 domain-containing protein [Algoriphagus sp. TR-M9]